MAKKCIINYYNALLLSYIWNGGRLFNKICV